MNVLMFIVINLICSFCIILFIVLFQKFILYTWKWLIFEEESQILNTPSNILLLNSRIILHKIDRSSVMV